MITLRDGRVMYIREAKIEEAPMMMEYVKQVMEVDHDFYDIVSFTQTGIPWPTATRS